MSDVTRRHPALDISWPSPPADPDRDLLLTSINDDAPTAVEDTAFGARVFFADGDARDRAAVRLATVLPGLSCTYIDVDDERWAERSQEALSPIQVGSILVVPAYDPAAPSHGSASEPGHEIFIHPSMGFGTGHHASTRLCLALLQQIPIAGASVLDAGTGSGVLAIAAAHLGAATVRAIDTDPDALQSAGENVELNDAQNTITLALSDLASEASGPWDVVVANLTGAHLAAAAGALDALATAPGGRLILGGLQVDEEPEVVRAFSDRGWSVSARLDEDGWAGLLLTSGF